MYQQLPDREKKEVQSVCPANRAEWRNWLVQNAEKEDAVWLIYHKKSSGQSTLTWVEAVEEALCFGWIDSIKKTRDADTFVQFFSRRKGKSTWSKINKLKVEQLIAQGLFTAAGHLSIEIAKENGSWSILDDVENLIIPADLEQAFELKPGSKQIFLKLSRTVRKQLLQGLVLAKRPETREARILCIVNSMEV